jgi:hypothetical protein
MDPNKTKAVFFYAMGIFNIFPWNTVLNLNAFFEESFENPNISKLYTFCFFVFVLGSIKLAIEIDRFVDLQTSMKILFAAIFISFNLIYVFCNTLSVGFIKYLLFMAMIIVLSISNTLFSVL